MRVAAAASAASCAPDNPVVPDTNAALRATHRLRIASKPSGRVVPHAVEFWYGARYRLHERWLHERGADGNWTQRMLYP